MPRLSELQAQQEGPRRVKLSELQDGMTTDADLARLISNKQKRGGQYASVLGDNAITENVAGAVDAFGHHLLNLPQGIGQLAGHGGNALVQAVAGGSDYAKGVQSRIDTLDADERQRENRYQARTEDNAGSYVGAVGGEVLPWVTGIGALRSAGLMPQVSSTLAKLGLLAGEGAVMGAAQPVRGENFGLEKALQVGIGGATGPLLYGAGKVAQGLNTARRYLFAPESVANQRVSQMLGAENPQAAIASLRNAEQFVPGEAPTAASVLATPRAVGAERALRNNPESAELFAQSDAANNAARLNVVRELAGDEAKLQSAIQARRDATGDFYRDHLAPATQAQRYSRASKVLTDYVGSRNIDMPEFKVLDEARRVVNRVTRGNLDEQTALARLDELSPKRRASQKVLAQARSAIDNNMVQPDRLLKELRNLSMRGNPAVRSSAKQQMAFLQEHMEANGGRVPAVVLDDMRQNIGKTLADNATNGIVGSQEAALYDPFKAKLSSTLERAIPGYRANLATYAAKSEPINTMESVGRLLDPNGPGGLNVVGDSVLAASRLKSVLRGDDKARFPMSVDARQQLEGVRSSLDRRSITDNKLAAAGPGTAADQQSGLLSGPIGANLKRGAGILGGGLLGNLTGLPAGELSGAVVGGLLGDALKATTGRVSSKAVQKMTRADLAAAALEKEQQRRGRQRIRSLLDKYLLPYESLPAP